MPYELQVRGKVSPSSSSVTLEFSNTGKGGAVFQVRSGNAADPVRNYTVEPGKKLAGVWTVAASYDLSVYGPNGFLRQFEGSIGAGVAVLDVRSRYRTEDGGGLAWSVTNAGTGNATVSVLDAYSGKQEMRVLKPHTTLEDTWSLDDFHNWYDVVVTVAEDASFQSRLAGHVETGEDSYSDPALGGLVQLKA